MLWIAVTWYFEILFEINAQTCTMRDWLEWGFMGGLSCQDQLAAEREALLQCLWHPFPLALAWGIKCVYVVVVLSRTCLVFCQFGKLAYLFHPHAGFLTVQWTGWSHMRDQISMKGWWHVRGSNMQLGGHTEKDEPCSFDWSSLLVVSWNLLLHPFELI